jgi:hypothetical protein
MFGCHTTLYFTVSKRGFVDLCQPVTQAPLSLNHTAGAAAGTGRQPLPQRWRPRKPATLAVASGLFFWKAFLSIWIENTGTLSKANLKAAFDPVAIVIVFNPQIPSRLNWQ